MRIINTIILLATHCALISESVAQTDFTFTGAEQTYVVPVGVSAIQIEAWGAQGGLSRLTETIKAGGFSYCDKAAETPFNLILEIKI